jgi:hypothetical protein
MVTASEMIGVFDGDVLVRTGIQRGISVLLRCEYSAT